MPWWLRCALRRCLMATGGAPRADRRALVTVLEQVLHVAEEVPELVEFDLNPILVSPDGALAVDCKARLAPRQPGPGPLFPALRRRPQIPAARPSSEPGSPLVASTRRPTALWAERRAIQRRHRHGRMGGSQLTMATVALWRWVTRPLECSASQSSEAGRQEPSFMGVLAAHVSGSKVGRAGWPATRPSAPGQPGRWSGCRGRRALAPAAPGGVACDSPAWQLLRLAPVRGKMAYPAKVCGLRRSRGWHPSRPARMRRPRMPGEPPNRQTGHTASPWHWHCGAMKVTMELTRPRSFNAPAGHGRSRGRP
jgi:hypothetical protein